MSKWLHDASLQHARSEAIDTLVSGFVNLATYFLEKNGAIAPDMMAEALIKAGVKLHRAHEPIDQVLIMMLGLTADLKRERAEQPKP